MKAAQALILALVVSALLALPLAASAGAGEGYMFYVFADSRCPHCKSLIEFFREQGFRHSVCFADLSAACNALFADFLGATGLPGLVPATVAVADGRVAAIVVGALRDAQFWEMAKTGRGEGGDIPVYMPAGAGAVKAGSVPASREEAVASILSRFPEVSGAGGTRSDLGEIAKAMAAFVALMAITAFLIIVATATISAVMTLTLALATLPLALLRALLRRVKR